MKLLSPSQIICAPLVFSSFINYVSGSCHITEPTFPPPDYSKPIPELLEAFTTLEGSLAKLAAKPEYNTSSYSIEVTSSDSTLWSTFHTAFNKDPARPGADQVNGNSTYRIASVTKTFTVLALLQQHAAGNLSLDDTVNNYISELRRPQNGTLPWHDITLRALASQLSGLPRDFAQGDMAASIPDPTTSLGLPPIPLSNVTTIPHCDSYANYTPCTPSDLLHYLRNTVPLFAPNQKSTYSNLAFELLGLVLSNVTSTPYESHITSSILNPLNLTSTTFTQPPDPVAVLPANASWYFDVDEGVQNPTGGLYSSSSDMSKFLRWILDHHNAITPALNWLSPVSFTAGVNSYYGMPWEIFRPTTLLSRGRTVTFYTKGGGLPGYSTIIIAVPEFELGITILTAGHTGLLGEALEMVTKDVVRAADQVAARQMKSRYAGMYTFDSSTLVASEMGDDVVGMKELNTSLALSYTPASGLTISHFISNGTDVMSVFPAAFNMPPSSRLTVQLMPTLLYRDQKRMKGELWRMTLGFPSPPDRERGVWDDFCITDVDGFMYAGRPFAEVVFWDDDGDEEGVGLVELAAFRVKLRRVRKADWDIGKGDELVIQ